MWPFKKSKREERELALLESIHTQTKTYQQLVDVINRSKSTLTKDVRTNPYTQLREYKSWVSSCASLLSDSVSRAPYRFYKKDTGEEITTRNHAFKTFTIPFNNPNPLMSFRFIKAWCQLQLDLCGTALIYKARNAFGEARELWPLDMNFLHQVTDPEGKLLDFSKEILPSDVIYWFNYNGNIYPFSLKKDLIALYYPHPTNKFIGASPVQLQAYAVDLQTYIEIYERDFFKNSARPDFALVSDHDIGQDKAEEIKERWKEKYSGTFFDIAVLGSGLKPVPFITNNKDLAFLELAQWTKELVLGAYRVPEAKLGKSDSANRSNSVYTDIYYNKEAVGPRLELWDVEITSSLIAEYDDRVMLVHDNPIPRDRDLETKETRVYLSGAPCMTIDEIRKEIHNLPPLPDGLGKEVYIPGSFVPLSKLAEMVESKNNSQGNGGLSNTDPARHDNDEPHLNPDGSDDRDNMPTEGRTSLSNIEKYLKHIWISNIQQSFISKKRSSDILDIVSSVIRTYASLFVKSDIDMDVAWASRHSQVFCEEIYKTLKTSYKKETNWKLHCIQAFDSNSRVVKVCNFMFRSVINYAHLVVAKELGVEVQWKVNSNACGHRGRLLNTLPTDKGKFIIGSTEFDFPGQIGFNLDCDCSLDTSEELVKLGVYGLWKE